MAHVTTGCRGNAFETHALSQSAAWRNPVTANQLAASEDLNQDCQPESTPHSSPLRLSASLLKKHTSRNGSSSDQSKCFQWIVFPHFYLCVFRLERRVKEICNYLISIIRWKVNFPSGFIFFGVLLCTKDSITGI